MKTDQGVRRYGGQAVIEGVMFRSRRSLAVAVRERAGGVHVHAERLEGFAATSPWGEVPFLRGVLLLGHGLSVGLRTLVHSMRLAVASSHHAPPGPAESELGVSVGGQPAPTLSRVTVAGLLATAVLIAVSIFIVLPLALASAVERAATLSPLAGAAVEGAIRLSLLVGYLWIIGRVPGVRRVFAYHGAEHKALNAYEAGAPLTIASVRRCSAAHPRCGTTFLLYVLVIASLIFPILGHPPFAVRAVSRVVLIPVIASIAYETIRLAGRRDRGESALLRALRAPGMALQGLTTREPDAPQMEVAIAALARVIALENVPHGKAPHALA